MSTNVFPWVHAARVAAQKARGEHLALAVEAFRQEWLRADEQHRQGSRVKAGLRATLLPVLVERDELAAKLAAVEKVARDHENVAATFNAHGFADHAHPHQMIAHQLRKALA